MILMSHALGMCHYKLKRLTHTSVEIRDKGGQ